MCISVILIRYKSNLKSCPLSPYTIIQTESKVNKSVLSTISFDNISITISYQILSQLNILFQKIFSLSACFQECLRSLKRRTNILFSLDI